MRILYKQVAGSDVHKKTVVATRMRITSDDRLDWETKTLSSTIPGIDRQAAKAILAEIGLDMGQFPADKDLVAWAGLVPGNNESVGKRYSGRTRKDNAMLGNELGGEKRRDVQSGTRRIKSQGCRPSAARSDADESVSGVALWAGAAL